MYFWTDERLVSRPTFRFSLDEALESIRDHGRPCTLCGDEARNPGCWIPTPRLAVYPGAPPGKDRAVVYSLCSDCWHRDGVLGAVWGSDPRRSSRRTGRGLALVDRIVRFGTPEDVARFAAAWERFSPPRPMG